MALHPRSVEPVLGNGIFGSDVAGQFLKDCRAGLNSVDIITIGDSNAGNGNAGYQVGLAQACSDVGMPIYATPVGPTADSDGNNNRVGSYFLPHNNFMWLGDALPAAGVGTCKTLTTEVAASKAPAVELAATLGYNSSILPKTNGFQYNAAYVHTAITYSSQGNACNLKLYTSSPMNSGNGTCGISLQYRLVYGKFSQTGGSFKLGAFAASTLIGSSASFSTNGTSGFDTATYSFTSALTSSLPQTITCNWDGWNGNFSSVVGPFAALWHSIIQIKKGFCVSNLIYDGGKTSAQIADRVEGMGTSATSLMASYLKEMRQRQIAAGGTGRVIVWCNSGVNGPDSSGSWVTAAIRIRNAFSTTWQNLGFPKHELAFILSVTHPQSVGSTETALIAERNLANNWATVNKNDGNNVCVVDISRLITREQLLAGHFYDVISWNTGSYDGTLYTAHLRGQTNRAISSTDGLYTSGQSYDLNVLNNGYQVVCDSIFVELLK